MNRKQLLRDDLHDFEQNVKHGLPTEIIGEVQIPDQELDVLLKQFVCDWVVDEEIEHDLEYECQQLDSTMMLRSCRKSASPDCMS